MRVRVVEREFDPGWVSAIAALTTTKAADVVILRGESLVTMPPDDFYVWWGGRCPLSKAT